MSSILDLAISISLADHISSGVKNIIGHFKLLDGATSDVQKKMDGFKTLGFVGAAAGVAGGLAFKGMTDTIVGAVKPAMEFEAVMNNVKMAAFGKDLLDKSKAEEVKKTLNDLTTGFEKLGIATKFSDKGTAEAALGMLRGGIDTKFIEGSKDAKGNYNYSGLSAAMYAAQLGDIDPQASGDFIAKQKAAFNMTGDRTLEAVNFYSKTAAASTMDMKSLIPGMLTASGVAGSLHMKPEDTALLVAATGTYTKDGGSAGTFTKDFLDRLIPHTKKQKQAMGELGWMNPDGKSSIFFDEQGISKGADFMFKTLQEASHKFRPDQFQNMMSKVFLEQGKNTALALANDSKVYEDIKKNIGNQLDMYQQVDIQMSGTKLTMESLGETWNIVKRVFGDPFLDPIKESLKTFNKYLGDSIIPWAKAHPQIIQTIAAVALGASAFLAIGGAITVGVAAVGALTTAVGAVGVSLGSVALIAAGVTVWIGEAAGSAYLIYKNWDKIVPFAKSVWEQVKTTVQTVWSAIAPTINAATAEVWNTIRSAWGQISSFGKSIWPDMQRLVEIYWPMISTMIGFHMKTASFVIKFYGDLIGGYMKFTWTMISALVGGAWTIIKDVVKLGWDTVTGIITIGLKLLTGDWAGAWEAMKNLVSGWWKNLGTLFSDFLKNAKEFNTTFQDAANVWGNSIVDGIINGIKSQWSNLKSTMAETWEHLKKAFTDKGQIQSPSRDMMRQGGFVTEGLALGIMGQIGLVKGASAAMYDAVGAGSAKFNPVKPGASGIDVARPSNAFGAGGITLQGPLIGEVYQQPGENTQDLAERVADLAVRKWSALQQRSNLTIGTRGTQRGY